jgi:hypothetical protein
MAVKADPRLYGMCEEALHRFDENCTFITENSLSCAKICKGSCEKEGCWYLLSPLLEAAAVINRGSWI